MKTTKQCSCKFRTKKRCGEAYPVNVGRKVLKNSIRHYWKCSKCGEKWIQVVVKKQRERPVQLEVRTAFPQIEINWIREKEPEKSGEILVLYFNGFFHCWKVLLWDERNNKWGQFYGDEKNRDHFRFWARLDAKKVIDRQP